ncbi:MAG: hypothetical protein IKB47_03035 [Clostridia bacterium]|nr:hypothetical protein [Clostridia bacterium]
MSKWNDFCAGVSKTTKSTADKTKNIANLASLRVKLGTLESKVADEYDTLGRIYYSQEVGKIDSGEALRDQIRAISDINKQINAVNAEIREIKRLEAEAKAAREAEKEAKRAAKEAARAAEEAAELELDVEVEVEVAEDAAEEVNE